MVNPFRFSKNSAIMSDHAVETSPSTRRRVLMFPLWFFQSYLTVTVLIFAFGPWPWPVPDPLLLYTFIIFAHVALWIGYKVGVSKAPGRYYGKYPAQKLIFVSLIANYIWIIPTYMLRMGMREANIGNIIASISTGLLDPGAMYAAKLEAHSESMTSPLLSYATILLSPALWLLVPLSITYWKNINGKIRFFVLLFIFVDLLSWVATGTNKGIADFVILVPWLLIAGNPSFLRHIQVKKLVRGLAIGFAGAALLLSFFALGQKGRGGGSIATYDNSARISVDFDNVMMKFLPPAGQGVVAAITTYLVQGYYGLSLAIEEPFDTSYGVGNSFYLLGLAESVIGHGTLSERTYPAKIEKYNWDRYAKWHTFYTWIASDVSFPGTILVVYVIGIMFGMVWRDVLLLENPFAIAVFALFIIMLFYFPANNQVLAFSRTSNAFIVLVPVWLLTRKRYVL